MIILQNKKLLIILAPFLLMGLVSLIYLNVRSIKTPPDTDNSFRLGEYYFNHGLDADGTYDLIKARQYYETALKENPRGNNLAWYQLGRIDFLEGKFNAALYKFNKQIEYFSDSQPSVYYMIALTYGYRARYSDSIEDWHHASDNFLHYLVLDPDSPWARTDLSWVYFSQGHFEEMKPILEEGLKSHPDNPWLLNMYGLALLNTSHTKEAGDEFIAAKQAASLLSVEDWGRSYPGNDPSLWSRGLSEFQSAINKNIELTELTTGN